jgi:thiol-disulfide isomerase/thioredoxin
MMTARKQAAVVVGVIGIALALLFAGKRILGNELSPLGLALKHRTSQPLTLDSIPQSKSLDAYKGDVILVNIWATWCLPCPSGDAE